MDERSHIEADVDRQGANTGVARAVFVGLVALEGVAAVPLAVALPFSRLAVACAAAILVMLQLALIATVGRSLWQRALQVAIVLVSGGSLALALGSHGPSWAAAIATVVGLNVCLSALGLVMLRDTGLGESFATQEFALVSSLSFWILMEHFEPVLDAAHTTPFGHLGMGLRFVFSGPLLLVPIVFGGRAVGWNGHLRALAAVCFAQLGMGFLELGTALESLTLVIGGVLGAFGLLVVLGLMRRPAGERPHFR